MATIEFTYKGRRIWIDPYRDTQGWRVRVEVWEVGEQGVHKDDIRLPANYFFRSLRSARTFAERMTKRGIDRRQEQEEIVSQFHPAGGRLQSGWERPGQASPQS